MQNVQVVSLGSLQNGYFQMLMGGQHVVRVFQISQVVVQWSKESESTVRAESIFLSTIICYSQPVAEQQSNSPEN